MADEPTVLPFTIPPIGHLTPEEIQALRNKISVVCRSEKEKATRVLSSDPKLRGPWVQSASMHRDNPKRLELMNSLQSELLKHPEAFLSNTYLAVLFAFDNLLRDEQLRRGSLPKPKTKRKKGDAADPATSDASDLPWEAAEKP